MAYHTPSNLSKGLSGAEYLSSGGIFKRRKRHEPEIKLSSQSFKPSSISGINNHKPKLLSYLPRENGKRKDTFLEGSGYRWESKDG